jgi:dTDP-4-amino-4,6-dideoxygalactose transaminase
VRIPVSKPLLPDKNTYFSLIESIYRSNFLTNNGPLVRELSSRLESYLGVKNLLVVSNGTLALQIAMRTLLRHEGMDGVGQTTPFTFIATSSAMNWEGITPEFVDIDPTTFCMNPALVTKKSKLMVPVHVYGNLCDVEAFDALSLKHSTPVLYDAAHAFGVKYKGHSCLNFGDASTLSFHATKIFHSVEGGAIVFKKTEDLEYAKTIINFGLTTPTTISHLGINAKMSEFHAAMGLCQLDLMDQNLEMRSQVWDYYTSKLQQNFDVPVKNSEITNNFAYFPLLLESEAAVEKAVARALDRGIQLRRYFYPSLDTIELFGKIENCPLSQDRARRIVCLPIYAGLTSLEQDEVVECLS